MARQYWLVKSEPDAFSWDMQVANGVEPWTGVRNFTARNRPQIRPTAVSTAPLAASHGSAAPDRRRKRPGLAKRCRERPGFRPLGGGATTELASTPAT